MSHLKRVFNIMPNFLEEIYYSFINKKALSKWKKQGYIAPTPHIIKQQTILSYKKKYNIDVLVESGTYEGDMIWAQKNNFKRIYSIELTKYLIGLAQKRFKKYNYIQIIHGDSGKLMPILIKKIQQPAIFWLDAHYSGDETTTRGDKDCPISEEIKAILTTSEEHIILISDAHKFTGQRDYPTLSGLSKYILSSQPCSKIKLENDIIIVELKPKEEDDELETDV